jgi:hypothetical protein
MLEEMRKTFQLAASLRKDRSGVVQNKKGEVELEWMEFERQTMLKAVNVAREGRGLPPVTEDDVIRADRMAAGHIDYALKFPLYCAELALGVRPEP